MKYKVLVPFEYALDGVHSNRLKAGRSYEIRDEHVPRFEMDGLIEVPQSAPDSAPRGRRRKQKAE